MLCYLGQRHIGAPNLCSAYNKLYAVWPPVAISRISVSMPSSRLHSVIDVRYASLTVCFHPRAYTS